MRLDRLVAFVLLVLASPLLGVLALAVHLHDGGPALITVPRVGRHGASLRMWKLRSMRPALLDGRAGGSPLTSGDDDRVTPLGRRLRALHLDELPQLWNVVRGEMCLVGPRPEAPELVDLEDQRWRDVLRAPPAMAGPTQLLVGDWELERIATAPAGEAYVKEVLPVKLAIDRWYVREASPGLDAAVLAALIRSLVGAARSRNLHARVRREVPEAGALPEEATSGRG